MSSTSGMYSVDYGNEAENEEDKVFVRYQKSADMGDSSATYNVGYCYHHGIGVEKDEHKAFIYYQKSADIGNIEGTYDVGYCYNKGIGVKKDEHKAFIYYKKSADMGNANGTYNVGVCYHHGDGVEKDEYKAFIYYKKSADMGVAAGMSRVGDCYRNGIGIARDLKEANNWYRKEKKLASVSNKRILKNPDIDDDLKNIVVENKYRLTWISYNEFENIQPIGKGGFATVFCAMWLDPSQNLWRDVALKLLHKSNGYYDEFIKELKAYCDIGLKNPTFLKCFGISKDSTSKDYILVMEYARMGSLRNNLHSMTQIEWEKKLNILLCIASDLKIIHSQDLIHRDLHSGNILQDDLHSAYIADLGLSISTNVKSKTKDKGIYGILPYIAPEVLNGEPYSKASDIYSLGIIMWEILYGTPVCYEQKDERQLQIQIYDGLRPRIFESTARCYSNLIKKCWDKKPEERPSAAEIYDIFIEWQNNKNILMELCESEKNICKIKTELMQEYVETDDKSKLISFNSAYQYQDTKIIELSIDEINEEEINEEVIIISDPDNLVNDK